MELKTGDVVMLKSGGQPLTVAEVKGDEHPLCLWIRLGRRPVSRDAAAGHARTPGN